MPISRFSVRNRILACLAVSALAILSLCSAASAAPITVNLRVEGATATLYEGPVSTEAIPALVTAASPEGNPCDVAHNGANGGFVPSGASPTAALFDAAQANGFGFNAKWFASLNDFEVTKAGSDENGGEAEGFPSWGYAVNYTTANVGGCQFQLAPGSEVLWAYNYFNLPHLLSLTGPATATAGTQFTVHVSDGQTGAPVSGAAIGQVSTGLTTAPPGGPVTDSSGNATISLTRSGSVALKATHSESVRSNGLGVCVHEGNDGSCGTVVNGAGGKALPLITSGSTQPATAETAQVLGLKNGHVYSRGAAPRVLRGVVRIAAGGTLRQVRIRLHRSIGGRCFNFSGSKESFVRSPKCATAAYFSVGDAESFSYLLPARLPAGRYVYDIQAVDSSGRTTALVGGVSHVVFRVK
jgi:hypothetical protein